MPEPWRDVSIDGDPPDDLSGNMTPYEVFDGTTVQLAGRLNNRWLEKADGPLAVTHWKPLVLSDQPEE